MAKKSKQLVTIEKLEARKTAIRKELIKVIRGFNKKGEQLLQQAAGKDAKIISLKKKGMDPGADAIRALTSESEALKKAANDEIGNVTALMKQYTAKIEADYQSIKNAYESLAENPNAAPARVKQMAAKLEEAEFRLESAENLIERAERGILPAKVSSTFQQIWMNRLTYIMILPSFIATSIFAYWPMYGVLLAFKKWELRKGILNSPWEDNWGMNNFIKAFGDPYVIQVIKNTLIISSLKLICGTAFVILLALLLNEVKNQIFKRSIQSIIYLPHFLSWIIMVSFLMGIFSMSSGVVNKFIIQQLGGQAINFMAEPKYFRALLILTEMWKEGGWSTIIYLAAITGISPGLYEAAIIDGANRFRQALYVTIPCIKGTVILLLILSVGGILSAGFDQVFNLMSPAVMNVADILDTYVYRLGVQQARFEMGTAIGLSKNLISIILIISVDRIAKLFGEDGIF